jgi:hypothetical protein
VRGESMELRGDGKLSHDLSLFRYVVVILEQ